MTQPDGVNWLNGQIGKHLDYDNAHDQQCVDFFNFYYRQVTGRDPFADGLHSPHVEGAKDLWNARIGDFTYIPDSAGLEPQPGDIAIYGSGWGGGYGHVEVVVETDGTGCLFVGENEHGNITEGVVRVHRTWAQMRGLLGVMRYHWTVPVTAPSYIISSIDPKPLHVKANRYKWNLAQPNWQAVVDNPITTSGDGVDFTAVATLRRPDAGFQDYFYYLEDANTPHGWNSLDCDDPVPTAPPAAPPPIPMPTPYVPPAPPVTAPLARKYKVVTTLLYFDQPKNARFKLDALGTLSPKTYYRFADDHGMIQLGDDNHHPKYWINSRDNVILRPDDVQLNPEPAIAMVHDVTPPEDWKASYRPFVDGKSRKYRVLRDMFIIDLSGTDKHGGIEVKADTQLPIFGSLSRGGLTYLIPFLNDANGQPLKDRYYGVPTDDVYSGLPNLESEAYRISLSRMESDNRVYRKSVGHETTADKLYYAQQLISRAVKDGMQFFDIIPLGKLKAMLGASQKDINKK